MAIDTTFPAFEAVVKRLAYLLEIDEAGWEAAAQWLESQSLDDGIDLWADRSNPIAWARTALTTVAKHADEAKFLVTASRVLETAHCLDEMDLTAEELFWRVFPDWRRSGL